MTAALQAAAADLDALLTRLRPLLASADRLPALIVARTLLSLEAERIAMTRLVDTLTDVAASVQADGSGGSSK